MLNNEDIIYLNFLTVYIPHRYYFSRKKVIIISYNTFLNLINKLQTNRNHLHIT